MFALTGEPGEPGGQSPRGGESRAGGRSLRPAQPGNWPDSGWPRQVGPLQKARCTNQLGAAGRFELPPARAGAASVYGLDDVNGRPALGFVSKPSTTADAPGGMRSGGEGRRRYIYHAIQEPGLRSHAKIAHDSALSRGPYRSRRAGVATVTLGRCISPPERCFC